MDKRGTVILVGAGPGDPGLLTLAGKAALEAAEVVLYDRLSAGALRFAARKALRIDVGKQGGSHPIPQQEINRLLVEHGRSGKRVVRLKGGDPYLFGRGGEEAEALAEAGIPFRVVPGVTSAVAVPGYAGIPVTHRDYASSVHIVTGHGRDGRPPRIAYEALAGLDGTLVFLMGVTRLGDICSGLLHAGMGPDTPCALVENGTLPAQRTLASTLADLPRQAAEWGAKPPAILIVGEVCKLAEACGWTRHLPLWGKEMAVAASAATGSRLTALLEGLGCGVTEAPCIETVPLPQPDGFWRGLGRYNWIVLTSPVGAELFFDRLRQQRVDLRSLQGLKFAAVGSKTAAAIEDRGILVDLVPQVFDGLHLAAALAEAAAPGDRLLLFRAKEGMERLPEALEQAGIPFDDVAAYETVLPASDTEELAAKLRSGALRHAAFTSASAVRGFKTAAGGASLTGITALCIGESTAAAAKAAGMTALVSGQATVESLAELAVKALGE